MFELTVIRNRTKGWNARRGKTLDSVEVTKQFLASYFEPLDREHLVVVCLDAQLRLIGWNLVGIGAVESIAVSNREVFKAAVLANATSVILAHNHPSGNSKPSQPDLEFTDKALQAGRVLGIPVLDHLVFGDDGATSIRDYVREEAPESDRDSRVAKLLDVLKAAGIPLPVMEE